VTPTKFKSSHGVDLHFEESGKGPPIIFLNEFATDNKAWEPQIQDFSRAYRCIAVSPRGHILIDPPTDHDTARRDVIALMDYLGVERAHLVGYSTGAYTALHVGLFHPERCISLAVTGCRWGSPAGHDLLVHLCNDITRMFAEEHVDTTAYKCAQAAMKMSFKSKEPGGPAEFVQMLGEQPAFAAALKTLSLQLKRCTLWELELKLKALQIPLLVFVGDEDVVGLEGSLFLKKAIPGAELLIIPRAGHEIRSEERAIVNASLAEFFSVTQSGR
jgi:pimeloyl-ACP methyl ester carboxylesterase